MEGLLSTGPTPSGLNHNSSLLAREMEDVINHPVHGLLSSTGSLLPSALVPFCAFASDLSFAGQVTTNITFPVCSQFKPAVIDGQQCYQLDIGAFSNRKLTRRGKENGLLLILDINAEKGINVEQAQGDNDDHTSMDFLNDNKDAHSAKIYIDTLDHFFGKGPGNYEMTALKKITGTPNFLMLPEADKGCQMEKYEECMNKQYVEMGKQICGCVPFALGKTSPTSREVRLLRR